MEWKCQDSSSQFLYIVKDPLLAFYIWNYIKYVSPYYIHHILWIKLNDVEYQAFFFLLCKFEFRKYINRRKLSPYHQYIYVYMLRVSKDKMDNDVDICQRKKEKRRRKKKMESMMFRTDYFCFENLHFHFTNIRIEEIHKRIKLKLTLGCYNGIRFGGILY